MQNLKKNCLVVWKITGIWKIFTRALVSLKMGLWFDRFVCPKLKICELKIYRGSYMSWEWRIMQKLRRNWLLCSKSAWAIWRILIQALKNLHFNGPFALLALDIDVKYERKLTFAFKNDMKNLGNFHQRLESLKSWTLMGFF